MINTFEKNQLNIEEFALTSSNTYDPIYYYSIIIYLGFIP